MKKIKVTISLNVPDGFLEFDGEPTEEHIENVKQDIIERLGVGVKTNIGVTSDYGYNVDNIDFKGDN